MINFAMLLRNAAQILLHVFKQQKTYATCISHFLNHIMVLVWKYRGNKTSKHKKTSKATQKLHSEYTQG